jgi:UDP-N-acetylglucosamine 2-epimerase
MVKVMTIVGTRPELIKMSRVIAAFDEVTDHILVHTGQNYDYQLNQVFFDDLGIRKPDFFLEAVGQSPIQTIAKVLEKIDPLLDELRPDAVLIYGDTNSALSVIAAKRRKIPIFHMEAGNRCFDQRVPEEINRKVVDHLSDVNLVLTEHARRYLLAEGIAADRIFKTGSHLDEVLRYYAARIDESTICSKLKLDSKAYFLVSAHREENVDSAENLSNLLNSLKALWDAYSIPVIVSTHPRTEMRLRQLEHPLGDADIRFLRPFGFFDYIQLQRNAKCVLSDSGTITEESSLLGFPAVMIRMAHERPEGMDVGTLIMSGLLPESVLNAVRVVIGQQADKLRVAHPVQDYLNPNVSSQIIRIVLSYIEYVNRVVWSKN